ncbi:MAG: CDP-alcohol phosphatidyltransferase family protein [Candidatus Bathyarchaeota archaeon]|nr:CDP-alcohol phosphatidyltransferase family protein [Candidatus Bathyarchaeum sp.]
MHVVSCVLFVFAVGTDLLDGYIAKKLEVTSRLGAYFDATADSLFVSSMLLVFVLEGLYQPWIVFLVVFVFVQFILTNMYLKRTIYDPVGKYYGSLMYGGIGLTMLFQQQLTYSIVTIGVVVATIATLFSRLVYILQLRGHKQN